MHRVFISYHHAKDEDYKDRILRLNRTHNIFVDSSVDTGDIDENLDDQSIKTKIRDEYLRDSSVTILLVGTETKHRKHIDWEIFSSMYDGKVNKKSGILVVTLPSTKCTHFTAPHDGEKTAVYPEQAQWMTIDNRAEYVRRYPYLPDRIIDNLLAPKAKISVTEWDRIDEDPVRLAFLIDAAYNDRTNCEYDLSREMRRKDS